jgi:hypothetical protein
MQTIRIGCGAGYSGDRITPALALMEHGDIDYIIFECLAERTIALAQQRKRSNGIAMVTTVPGLTLGRRTS